MSNLEWYPIISNTMESVLFDWKKILWYVIMEFLMISIYYINLTCSQKQKQNEQFFCSILWEKRPQHHIFVWPCTIKICQQKFASFFLKKGTSQISCFGKIRKFSFYFGSLLHLKEVIEAHFSYFNIDDFNTFVVITLWQNRGDLLLMKEQSFC